MSDPPGGDRPWGERRGQHPARAHRSPRRRGDAGLARWIALDVDGKTEWMVWSWGEDWTWDEALRRRHIDLTTSSDCILLSRMMAEEDFVGHWANVDPADPRSAFAQPITKMRKVVFSKTLDQSKWPNTDLAKGERADEVTRRKAEQGKDIIAYGGRHL